MLQPDPECLCPELVSVLQFLTACLASPTQLRGEDCSQLEKLPADQVRTLRLGDELTRHK